MDCVRCRSAERRQIVSGMASLVADRRNVRYASEAGSAQACHRPRGRLCAVADRDSQFRGGTSSDGEVGAASPRSLPTTSSAAVVRADRSGAFIERFPISIPRRNSRTGRPSTQALVTGRMTGTGRRLKPSSGSGRPPPASSLPASNTSRRRILRRIAHIIPTRSTSA